MKVVIYARASVEAQKKFLDERIEKMKKYADTMGWTVIDTFVDVGFLGNTLERPALQDMINFIKTQNVDRVLISKLDRLSSNTSDIQFLIEDIFLKNNTHLVSLCEKIDTAQSYDERMLKILDATAQLFKQLEGEEDEWST